MSTPDAIRECELTILMPCLNEARTVAVCVQKALSVLQNLSMTGEVVVADNGSSDDSAEIARAAGARVVEVERRGYGAALRSGIAEAKGKYIIIGDADNSYDFAAIEPFITKLRQGYDLVMGNRFKGEIRPGAMPWLHKFVGNPVLSFLGRLFFRTSVGDFHCGLRGLTRRAASVMDLTTDGMEFASEMVVKACLHDMKICEVPITLAPDGRNRSPHLRSWRDGWRHLRFLLIFSPRWLFLFPGIAMVLLGLVVGAFLVTGPRQIGTTTFDIHTLLYAAACVIIGFNSISFAIVSRIYAWQAGLIPRASLSLRIFDYITLEVGLIVGAVVILSGLALAIGAFAYWSLKDFGPMSPEILMRVVTPSSMALILGSQIIFTSFLLSILGIRRS